MHRGISRHDIARPQKIGPSVEIGYHTACLPNQDRSRRDVPGTQPDLEESLTPPAGEVRQVESGRTRPPEIADFQEDIPEEGKVGIDHVLSAKREPRRDEAVSERGSPRYPYLHLIMKGPPPLFRRKKVIPGRIIDHAHDDFPRALEPDRYTEKRIPVYVVRRSVEGIDYPPVLSGRAIVDRLLGQKQMIGEGLADDVEDDPLRFPVDAGDEIGCLLEGDIVRRDGAQIVHQMSPRSAGSLHGGIEKYPCPSRFHLLPLALKCIPLRGLLSQIPRSNCRGAEKRGWPRNPRSASEEG